MFKKFKRSTKPINDPTISEETPSIKLKDDQLNDNENNEDSIFNKEQTLSIYKIKDEIDKKYKKTNRKGIEIKPAEEKLYITYKKEEPRESTVKKVFLSETMLQQAKNPEELQKLLGMKREEVDRQKEEKRKGLLQMNKELFSLPSNLQFESEAKDDHVDHLIKLSAAGLIEVPLPLEQKLKNIEETEELKRKIIDHKLAEELDYLKVLKKLGPSYAKGYKSDLSHKKLAKLNQIFENVFVNENGRRKKFSKERILLQNRKAEEN
jgi:hypothetical protein